MTIPTTCGADGAILWALPARCLTVRALYPRRPRECRSRCWTRCCSRGPGTSRRGTWRLRARARAIPGLRDARQKSEERAFGEKFNGREKRRPGIEPPLRLVGELVGGREAGARARAQVRKAGGMGRRCVIEEGHRSATPLKKHGTDQGTGDESESTKARAGRAWTTAQGQSKRRARRGGARTERGLRASQHRHRRAHRWRDRCSRSGGGGGSGGDGRRIARR